jgi:hypothetical protein
MVKRILLIIYWVCCCQFILFSQNDGMDSDSIEVNYIADSLADAAEVDDENTISNDDDDVNQFEHRAIYDESWQKIKQDKEFIYQAERSKGIKKNSRKFNFDWMAFFSAGIFKFLFIASLVCLGLFILWIIVKDGEFNYFKKRRTANTKQENCEIENVEVFTEWQKALKDALAKQDYRLATRVLYLELLQKMNQHEIIKYSVDLTNWDYVTQLLQSHYLNDFTRLTNYFDHVWYGFTPINEVQFEKMQDDFSRFKQLIN